MWHQQKGWQHHRVSTGGNAVHRLRPLQPCLDTGLCSHKPGDIVNGIHDRTQPAVKSIGEGHLDRW
jgi:hypothetical protein